RRAVQAPRLEPLLHHYHLDELRVVEGNGQTDVAGRSCNKGNGLRYLRQRLGARMAAAIGDSIEDLALFRAADQSYAPANVHPALVAAVGAELQVVPGRAQRALLQVARALAHQRDRCVRGCDGPEEWSEGVSILVEALGLRDRGRLQKLVDLVSRDAVKAFEVSG